MQIFLDSADVTAIKAATATGLVDGITTNPTLLAKAGGTVKTTLAEIAALVPHGPVSAEVTATDTQGMLAEAKVLAAIAPNIIIKLPLTPAGLLACQELAAKEIQTNVTLCFTAPQALLAAKAGATYVSPFIGRLEDNGRDAAALLADITTIYDNYLFPTQILFASVRSLAHVTMAAVAGCGAITMPPAIFHEMIEDALTKAGLEKFLADWHATGQSIL